MAESSKKEIGRVFNKLEYLNTMLSVEPNLADKERILISIEKLEKETPKNVFNAALKLLKDSKDASNKNIMENPNIDPGNKRFASSKGGMGMSAEKTEEQTKQYIRSLLAERIKPQRSNETEEEFSSRQQMIQQRLDVEADINPSLFRAVAQEDREPKADGGFPDLNKDGKVSYADVLKGRGAFAEGSMMVPPEMEMPVEEPPVDTYDNISPEEEMQQAEDMLPDEEMEEEYVDYVAEEVLEPEEQEYLFKVLDEDPRLEGILDKIILNATEFAGEGEVEGPGTGISDSIPARLSDGEFVITRKATDQIGADNLQKMMDDAERAYDGGLMGMANGGEAGTNPFVSPEEMYKLPKDEEADIERQMLYSSRMPSLMNR
jgi:hypothetical protein